LERVGGFVGAFLIFRIKRWNSGVAAFENFESCLNKPFNGRRGGFAARRRFFLFFVAKRRNLLDVAFCLRYNTVIRRSETRERRRVLIATQTTTEVKRCAVH